MAHIPGLRVLCGFTTRDFRDGFGCELYALCGSLFYFAGCGRSDALGNGGIIRAGDDYRAGDA